MSIVIFAADALSAAFCAFFSAELWKYAPKSWIWDQAPLDRSGSAGAAGSGRDSLAIFLIFYILISMTDGKAMWFSCPVYVILFQLSLCDSLYFTLQDQWSLFLAAIGILRRAALPVSPGGWNAVFFSGLTNGLTVIFSLWLLWIISSLLAAATKKDSPMGMGDVKLLSAAALLMDPESFLIACCAAFLLSGLWAAVILTVKWEERDQIAFGPFICLGIIGYLWSVSYI